MFRRWFIRGLALTLLTLCVVAWVGSYYRGMQGGHGAKVFLFVDLSRGRICVDHESPDVAGFTGWFWTDYRVQPGTWRDFDTYAQYHFVGFAVFYLEGRQTVVTVPLWFPTLLSALLLGFVWRKTRAKDNGKGFPIEPTCAATKAG